MEATLEKIKETQREAWNKSSAGWKKWDEMMMRFLEPVGAEMIHALALKEDHKILDVATGTGEPGLTIARMVKKGGVTGTDLSDAMLSVAAENASHRGLSNFETVCCDVSEMPFPDQTFDRVTCRFGVMFFPDMALGLREMVRVLKPGGRLVVSFWNAPEKNVWISNSMETMISRLKLNPPPGAPGLFRCVTPGLMADLFRETGLSDIKETEVTGYLPCDSLDHYWSFITEVASPMAFAKADPDLQKEIKEEILEKMKKRFPEGRIMPGSSATVIAGVKTESSE